MFIDALAQFDPAGTAITVTAVSTNVIDAGLVGLPPSPQERDLGEGPQVLDIFTAVGTAFTAAGAATLQISIQAARDNAGVPGTWYDQMMTGANPVANLTAGMQLCRTPMPLWNPAIADGLYKFPRFYRLNYVVATGPMTAGTLQSSLVLHNSRPGAHAYASGFTVAN